MPNETPIYMYIKETPHEVLIYGSRGELKDGHEEQVIRVSKALLGYMGLDLLLMLMAEELDGGLVL